MFVAFSILRYGTSAKSVSWVGLTQFNRTWRTRRCSGMRRTCPSQLHPLSRAFFIYITRNTWELAFRWAMLHDITQLTRNCRRTNRLNGPMKRRSFCGRRHGDIFILDRMYQKCTTEPTFYALCNLVLVQLNRQFGSKDFTQKWQLDSDRSL